MTLREVEHPFDGTVKGLTGFDEERAWRGKGDFLPEDRDPTMRQRMRKTLFDDCLRWSQQRGGGLENGMGVEVHVTENGHPYVVVSDTISRDYAESGHGHDILDLERFSMSPGNERTETPLFSPATMTLANGLELSLDNLRARGWLQRREDGTLGLELLSLYDHHIGTEDERPAETAAWLQELRIGAEDLGIASLTFKNGESEKVIDDDEVLSLEAPQVEAYIHDEDVRRLEVPPALRSQHRLVGIFNNIRVWDEAAKEYASPNAQPLDCEITIADSALHEPLYQELGQRQEDLAFPVEWGDRELSVGARFQDFPAVEGQHCVLEVYVASDPADADRGYVQEAAAAIGKGLAYALHYAGRSGGNSLPQIDAVKLKISVNGRVAKSSRLIDFADNQA